MTIYATTDPVGVTAEGDPEPDQELRTPWRPADYAPAVTGSGAEKLADSGIAPLIAASCDYYTISDEKGAKEAQALFGLGNATTNRGRPSPARRLRDAAKTGDAMMMPAYAVDEVKQAQVAGREPDIAEVQWRAHKPPERNGKQSPKYDFRKDANVPVITHPCMLVDWLNDRAVTVRVDEGQLKMLSSITALLRDACISDDDLGITSADLNEHGGLDLAAARERLRTLFGKVPDEKRVAIVATFSVTTWKAKPEWDSIDFKGRTVDLAPDGDIRNNPQVWRQASGLRAMLNKRKATVRLSTVEVEDDPKAGADDFLAKHGSWADIQAAVTDEWPPAPKPAGNFPEFATIDDIGRKYPEYEVHGGIGLRVGKVFPVYSEKEGEEDVVVDAKKGFLGDPLCEGWSPRIVAKRKVTSFIDDDADDQVLVDIEFRHQRPPTEEELVEHGEGPIEMKPAVLRNVPEHSLSGGWAALRSRAGVASGSFEDGPAVNREIGWAVLRDAELRGVPVETAYSHPGLVMHDGQPAWVRADGIITPDGFKTSARAYMGRTHQVRNYVGGLLAGRTRDQIGKSMRKVYFGTLKHWSDPTGSLSILGQRTATAAGAPPHGCTTLVGPGGLGKSTSARALARFEGPKVREEGLPNKNEKVGARVARGMHCATVFADDLSNPSREEDPRGREKLVGIAKALLTRFGEADGQSRDDQVNQRDETSPTGWSPQETDPAMVGVVLSMEAIYPELEKSRKGRMLAVHVAEGWIADIEALEALATSEDPHLAWLGTLWGIVQIAAAIDMTSRIEANQVEALKADLIDEREKLKADIAKGLVKRGLESDQTHRQAGNVAARVVGVRLWTRIAVSYGAITQEEADELVGLARHLLTEAAARHIQTWLLSDGPLATLMRLKELLASGECQLDDPTKDNQRGVIGKAKDDHVCISSSLVGARTKLDEATVAKHLKEFAESTTTSKGRVKWVRTARFSGGAGDIGCYWIPKATWENPAGDGDDEGGEEVVA